METSRGEDKSISEKIVIAMFGGTSKKLNQIELFSRFGLIAKSIVMTPSGGRTEDMKLFHIDFEEMVRTDVTEENGTVRPIVFEDSELYAYFADHEFLCILFEEAKSSVVEESPGFFIKIPHKLRDNKFIGFKRLVFSDQFIEEMVKPVWEDARNKVLNKTLEDVVEYRHDGSIAVNKSGGIRSAPNFIKSKDNDVFIRGSGKNSSLRYKIECINGIRMLPQYVWIRGTAVIDELKNTPEL